MNNTKGIPIVFINRNRLTALKKIIDWLARNEQTNIYVIDNGSTYPPLIDYYARIASVVHIVKLERNLGPWAIWRHGILADQLKDTPYIVSDSDLVPAAYCPGDLIHKLLKTLLEFPQATKVAPALRIDNIPENNGEKAKILAWEEQFWQKPLGRNVYAAPVDTTFALYRENTPFTNSPETNLRIGYPYIFEHTPWYVDDRDISAEELYYRNNIDRTFSWWSGEAKDKNQAIDKIQSAPKPRVLNIFPEQEKIPGWLNLSSIPHLADLEVDLMNPMEGLLPFEENSVDGVMINKGLNALDSLDLFMREVHRVCKHGAKVFIRVPYGLSKESMSDNLTRIFFEDSFNKYLYGPNRQIDPNRVWQKSRITVTLDLKDFTGSAIELQELRSKLNHGCVLSIEMYALKDEQAVLQVGEPSHEVLYTKSRLIFPKFEQL